MTNCQQIAFADIKPKLSGKRLQVYNAIAQAPKTLIELCEALQWQINCISGRVSELAKMGAIEEVGVRKNPLSGKNMTVWQVKELNLFS